MTATLAAGIAHDFNNMLGSITGLAEVCMLTSEAGTRLHTNLNNILLTGRKAASLVRQMLEYARQMPQACEPLCLSGLLRRIEPLLAVGLPGGVRLQVQTRGEAPVLADAVQIEQVLLNLVNNAGYAMRESGGTLTVTATCTAEGHNPLRRPAVHLQVSDEGCGIAPQDLAHIFEPFFTTKPVGEGTGLGLAAAYGIVKGHHGHIGVHSTVGQGTVFDIWLPLETVPQATA
ncbi:MAG: ATP-binding protein [Aquabacterium sp.]